MLYSYKDYGRQRGRRVGTLTASKMLRKAKEVKILKQKKIIKWLYNTRVKHGKKD